MRVVDLARAIVPDCTFKMIGIRPGEKLHETLINEDECRNVLDLGNYFIVLPQFFFGRQRFDHYHEKAREHGREVAYRSDNNDWWLDVEELKAMIPRV